MKSKMLLHHHWLTFLLMQWCFHISVACPSACVCKWKGGKQTVECVNKGLIAIPEGMDAGTQVLDFAGNNLQILPRERFERLNLVNLQRIYLSRCKLFQIDDTSFKGLTNLVELDLSENLLTRIPTETFSDFRLLMRLTVNENPIKTLRTRSFQPLSFLTTLELSKCEIEAIENDAFYGLERLEWLKLDNNKLSTIRGSYLLPASLRGVALDNNPWHCDCKLTELHAWLLNYKNIPQSIEPKCNSPQRLQDAVIKSLDVEDFACLPDVSPTTMYLEIGEGKNVSLLCQVSAIPEARVSWWFQGRVLQNDTMVAPGVHLYYYIEEGAVDKKSELFIFNTNTDDNGTFICVAENPAGKSQSNFTIRIIVREDVAVPVVLPYEYMVAVVSAIAVLGILVIIIFVLIVVRCRRQRSRKRKRERSKAVALQSPEQGADKSNEIEANIAITRMHKLISTGAVPAKSNGAIITERHVQMRHHEVLIRSGAAEVPGRLDPYQLSPNRAYQEQNPDLINDTESVGKDKRVTAGGRRREEGDGEEVDRDNCGNSYQEAMDNMIEEFLEAAEPKKMGKPGVTWRDEAGFPLKVLTPMREHAPPSTFSTLPRRMIAKPEQAYQLSADVHLSPGRFLDQDGYPADYGLPKMSSQPPIALSIVPPPPPAAYYRTLPYKRGHKKSYPREAEYLPAPVYEAYADTPTDVRYSVEGYPTSAPPVFAPNETFPDPINNFIPSPPAAYKSDITESSADGIKAESPAAPISPNKAWTGYSQSSSAKTSESQQNLIESAINAMVTGQPNTQHESPDEGFGEDGTEI
ncbi:leucine-rich repeat transmembrane neuronal protein 1-like [Neocloeon triangulifer]|uniref:leucine-rich repeat transmembrane neuronal protein 1-like n=1 Tax=Neocloeon triangulifer TaxID=2078957 RepID=UPI00286F1C59|nr:leucine-rich repeat transmembrane neuronal protein 1-like [Neocloeon triangulifer]